MKYFIILYALFYVLPTQATVTVYTDEASWQADAQSIAHHYHDDFNYFFDVTGDIGDNVLFGTGPTVQGQVISGVTEPVLQLLDLEYSTFAFGGHWDITSIDGQSDALLWLDVQGTIIHFPPDIFSSGGFLGVITDDHPGEYMLEIEFNGISNFSVTDSRIYVTPIPATVWLFTSGLIGLVSFAKHKKS